MANLYIKGVDISGYQPNVDFNAVKNDGIGRLPGLICKGNVWRW